MRFGILELKYRIKINLRKVTSATFRVTNLKIFCRNTFEILTRLSKTLKFISSY